jgi:hypothetical protein
LTDPAFDEDCSEVDSIELLAGRARLQTAAARGDLQAQKLLSKRDVSLRQAVENELDPLPGWLRMLVANVRQGRISPFVAAAVQSALWLAQRLERQEMGRRSFTEADGKGWGHHGRYQCPQCGAVAYREWRLDAPLPTPLVGYSADNGWRCSRCGAASGLPWEPAEIPPPSAGDLAKMRANLKGSKK